MKNIRLSGTKKRILIIAAVIVIIGAGWLWMQRGSRDGDALNLYGNVDIREVQLAFRQSGRVAQMLFDEGDHVEPGAHMAPLDAQPFEARSEERRVGQEWVRTCRSQWTPLH